MRKNRILAPIYEVTDSFTMETTVSDEDLRAGVLHAMRIRLATATVREDGQLVFKGPWLAPLGNPLVLATGSIAFQSAIKGKVRVCYRLSLMPGLTVCLLFCAGVLVLGVIPRAPALLVPIGVALVVLQFCFWRLVRPFGFRWFLRTMLRELGCLNAGY